MLSFHRPEGPEACRSGSYTMRSSVDTASVSIQNVKKIYGKNKLQENNIIMEKSIWVKTLTKINILEKNNRG